MCAGGLRQGWIGDGANMVALWVDGPLEKHLLGAPKLTGHAQVEIQAWRCPSCFLLSVFTPPRS